jgi:hypothetical protein
MPVNGVPWRNDSENRISRSDFGVASMAPRLDADDLRTP